MQEPDPTLRVRAHTSFFRMCVACGAALLMAIAFAREAPAEPRELAARVLWSRDGAIYVAADDTTALIPGMTLELRRGRKRIATATVTRRLDGHVAVARLDSGSLERERKLERLKLRGEAPAVARIPSLRLGLPGRGRTSLLFRCASTGVEARFAGAEYRADTLRAGALRLVRVAADGFATSATAPDTMHVRFFSSAADQEIALERGELDVAVFWPGELSPRMRTDPRWRDAERGLRARGVIVALLPARDTLGIPAAAVAALDREAFAGDLLPWGELEPAATPAATAPVGWQVDPALPGAQLLERILGRASSPAATRLARLSFLDVPVAARDAVQSTWRGPGVLPLFALRCPVLATPAFRPALGAWGGADAFANLLRCEGAR